MHLMAGIKFGLILPMISGLISACQVKTEVECQSANWSLLGYHDGYHGDLPRFTQRMETCMKYGFSLQGDQYQQYQKEYQHGIESYCQPHNIYKLALAGQGDIQACPIAQYTELKSLYESASRFYNNQQKIDLLTQQLEAMNTDTKMNVNEKVLKSKQINETLARLGRYQRLLQQDLDRYHP